MAKRKKKKITKEQKKTQDFLTRVKELRKINEPVVMKKSNKSEGIYYPVRLEWRGQLYLVDEIIGRWTIEKPEGIDLLEEDYNKSDYPRYFYRVKLENGYQLDLSNWIKTSYWEMTGIEPKLYEMMQNINTEQVSK